MRTMQVVRRLALLGLVLAAGSAAAAEQVYELTINNWARTNPEGEVEITYRVRINPAGKRTSTASAGVVCVGDPRVWKWASGSAPTIPQLSSPQQRYTGRAMLKAQGTWTGSQAARFWAVMGVECFGPSSRESNLAVTNPIAR